MNNIYIHTKTIDFLFEEYVADSRGQVRGLVSCATFNMKMTLTLYPCHTFCFTTILFNDSHVSVFSS